MAIVLPDHNLMIVEFPRTGTTWLRKTLKELNVPREILLPNVKSVCPRHSPANCYEWAGPCAVVHREVEDWLGSMWRFHCQRGQGKLSSPVRYWFEFLMPFDKGYTAWREKINLDEVNEYFRLMTAGCHIVEFREFQDWIEELLGVDVPRERINCSR